MKGRWIVYVLTVAIVSFGALIPANLIQIRPKMSLPIFERGVQIISTVDVMMK